MPICGILIDTVERSVSGMASGKRPEHTAPPEIVSYVPVFNSEFQVVYFMNMYNVSSIFFQFYNEDEARKYTSK